MAAPSNSNRSQASDIPVKTFTTKYKVRFSKNTGKIKFGSSNKKSERQKQLESVISPQKSLMSSNTERVLDRIENLFHQADPHMVPEDSSEMKSDESPDSKIDVSEDEFPEILKDGTVMITEKVKAVIKDMQNLKYNRNTGFSVDGRPSMVDNMTEHDCSQKQKVEEDCSVKSADFEE
jgi:hypothetical protein